MFFGSLALASKSDGPSINRELASIWQMSETSHSGVRHSSTAIVGRLGIESAKRRSRSTWCENQVRLPVLAHLSRNHAEGHAAIRHVCRGVGIFSPALRDDHFGPLPHEIMRTAVAGIRPKPGSRASNRLVHTPGTPLHPTCCAIATRRMRALPQSIEVMGIKLRHGATLTWHNAYVESRDRSIRASVWITS